MEVDHNEMFVRIEVDSKIYPLDVVYSAAYVFLDKAYVRLDGNPSEKIFVELRLKEEGDLEILGREFENELLNYAFYKSQVENSGEVRKIIMQRALLGTSSGPVKRVENDLLIEEEFSGDPSDIVPWEEDTSDISVPWEDKHGKE